MKRVLIISGEASGDHHGAALIVEALKINPNIRFLAMGGEKMRRAGAEIIVDSDPLAVVGVIEVLRHFYPIYQAWKTLRKLIAQNPPDLIVLIDYPGFNLKIAKVAKRAGIKVLYYIAPQVWAWKQHRVKKIRQYIDKILVIFPFEEDFYLRAGVPVEFIGHPLAGKVQPSIDPVQAKYDLHVEPQQKIIGLLPGSRKGEIRRLLPVMLSAAEQLVERYHHAIFVLPLAPSLTLADIKTYLDRSALPIKIVTEQPYNVLQLCDAAIVTSGTATLEIALLEVPMVIVYKLASLTFHIIKRIIKIPYVGLCNIVAGRQIVKELIQHEANPQNINTEICRILEDADYRQTMQRNLQEMKKKLGEGGASEKAAKALVMLLGEGA